MQHLSSSRSFSLQDLFAGRSAARALGAWALVAPLSLLSACTEHSDSGAEPGNATPSAPSATPPSAAGPDGAPGPSSTASAAGDAPDENLPELAEPTKPHEGPWLWVSRSSAGIYAETRPNRDGKLGYARQGAKLPVLPDKLEGERCSKGWYKIVGGGYICSMVGTSDPKAREAKFAPRQPDINEILPYPYARNAYNGTPLYRSLPSKAQMLEYEPYLPGAKAKSDAAVSSKATPPRDVTAAMSAAMGMGMGGASAADAEAEEKPWWQREDAKDRLHEVTLEQLAEEADGVLAKRMVRGFYIAIESTFKWSGRTWYKTTEGLIAPSERFWQAAASEFKGVEIDGETTKLPMAWVYGGRKTSTTYDIDLEKKSLKARASAKKFQALQLTGEQVEIAKKTYLQLADGSWVQDAHVRRTLPGKRPTDVGDNERWIDVNLSEQTVVAFIGDRPVYATLISSGKESRVKEKDHRTPRGAWRVREKHVTARMDGNGTAAGDLPYSIDDVPYVMYFHKAYATHGAFWHQNFGSQMSHGCVNLAPLDAKHLFYFADPPLPQGWGGRWSTNDSLGSMVVVHD